MSSSSAASNSHRGLFIVLEGLDRSGKSTQAQILLDRFSTQGRPAQACKFPDRTTVVGQLIDRYLRKEIELGDDEGKAIHLLFSANRWECAMEIERLLEEGTTVVCDRYAFSGLAFSLAKGLDADWLISPDKGLPLPDVTLFLAANTSQTTTRGGFGDERYERTDFQAVVREKFDWVGSRVNEMHGAGSWVGIDAGGSIEEVRARIEKAVDELKGRERRGKESRLWVA